MMGTGERDMGRMCLGRVRMGLEPLLLPGRGNCMKQLRSDVPGGQEQCGDLRAVPATGKALERSRWQ